MSPANLVLRDVEASSGRVIRTFALTDQQTTSSNGHLRLDDVSHSNKPRRSIWRPFTLYSYIIAYLGTLFLPTGYPHTVTADYTPYQIYDSLQAFASSIAGLLSSRAVLQSLNVVSSKDNEATLPAASTSAATAATILAVFQATLSNLTTILFASHAAPRISGDVKYYRFLADVVNDAAFVLDLLAPSLPAHLTDLLPSYVTHLYTDTWSAFVPSPKIIVLCTSSMLRAICGVAGGSSKAVLSSHFARNNPESVGDLNAKDSSQETVIGLLGMWAGGFVVSRIESFHATWIWMISLLALHLWTNWRAVKSVRLRNLNRERAGLVIERLLRNDDPAFISLDSIGAQESVLGLQHMFRRIWIFPAQRQDWRTWRIGVSGQEFISSIQNHSKSRVSSLASIRAVVNLFSQRRYLLCCDRAGCVIAFKPSVTAEDQLEAFVHGFVFQDLLHSSPVDADVFSILQDSQDQVQKVMPRISRILRDAGWDLSATNLDDGRGMRVEIA